MDVTVRCDNDGLVGIEDDWVEVTGEFIEATKDLKLGELLHDENFGLFDAMSAIEMMDPKMDAGMACNREKKVLNFQQAVDEGKLKIKDLTNGERIGIIDDTFSCLVTWLEGHSLAQTVFTNLYLHSPSSIEDKCLASFSFLTLKLVDIVKQFVLRANMVEDEDFQSGHVYHVPCDISDTKVLTMTRLIEEEYQRKVKSFQRNTQEKSKRHVNNDDRPIDADEKSNNKSNDLSNDNSLDQNSPPSLDKEFEENSALHSRMKFCRLFFQSLMNLKKEVFNKNDNPKELSVTLAAIDDTDKLLQQCGEIIQSWKKTLDLGIKPDLHSESACYYRADYPTIMGFEPLINQRLLPPTFPRYTKMRSREEALNFMASLVSRIRHVCKIYQVQTFHAALDFFTEFSQPSPTSSSCVLSRSILQVLYIRGIPIVNKIFGITPLSEALREDVKNFIKPPSLYYKPSILNTYPQAKEFLDIFFTRCIKPMFFLIQINGHNRARQRDKLAQVLDELAALQEEAERVDNFLHNLLQKQEIPCSHLGFFSTWVLYHTIRVMIQYLLSGFELELYSAHEYSYIYWYLYEFLFNWMVSTLNRARQFIQEQESLAEQKNRNAKKSRQRKRKQKPHEREWILYQALQQLCGGYFCTVSAFRLENKLKLPWTGLHGERIRYEHRFMPFNVVITPPPVTYSQYKEMTDFCNDEKDGNRTNNLYIKACKCFQQAKVLLESVPDPNEEITSLIKVAKTNFVVIKLLLSGHKEDSKSLPEFDFSSNNKFPIIRIL